MELTVRTAREATQEERARRRKSDKGFHVGVGHPIRKDKGIFNMGGHCFVFYPGVHLIVGN